MFGYDISEYSNLGALKGLYNHYFSQKKMPKKEDYYCIRLFRLSW